MLFPSSMPSCSWAEFYAFEDRYYYSPFFNRLRSLYSFAFSWLWRAILLFQCIWWCSCYLAVLSTFVPQDSVFCCFPSSVLHSLLTRYNAVHLSSLLSCTTLISFVWCSRCVLGNRLEIHHASLYRLQDMFSYSISRCPPSPRRILFLVFLAVNVL